MTSMMMITGQTINSNEKIPDTAINKNDVPVTTTTPSRLTPILNRINNIIINAKIPASSGEPNVCLTNPSAVRLIILSKLIDQHPGKTPLMIKYNP